MFRNAKRDYGICRNPFLRREREAGLWVCIYSRQDGDPSGTGIICMQLIKQQKWNIMEKNREEELKEKGTAY